MKLSDCHGHDKKDTNVDYFSNKLCGYRGYNTDPKLLLNRNPSGAGSYPEF